MASSQLPHLIEDEVCNYPVVRDNGCHLSHFMKKEAPVRRLCKVFFSCISQALRQSGGKGGQYTTQLLILFVNTTGRIPEAFDSGRSALF